MKSARHSLSDVVIEKLLNYYEAKERKTSEKTKNTNTNNI
jgi:hypothetical protein